MKLLGFNLQQESELNTETMIYFVGVPAMIAYLLLMLAYADTKNNKDKALKFPLRDAIVATLALDFSVIIPLFFQSEQAGTFLEGFNLLSVTIVLFCFHLSMLFHSRKLEKLATENHITSRRKRIMALVIPMYAGLLWLMSYSVSIEAVLAVKGGL